MRSITNLHWPAEPFGATQRPFAPDRPMMAAVSIGWTGYTWRPEWACVIYLYTDSTRTLELDGQRLNFGFEVLTSQPLDPPTAVPERLDDILVACLRHAKVLAGHDFTDDLDALLRFGVTRRLPGVQSAHQQWTTRQTKQRGTARLIDTAHDINGPNGTDLATVSERAALTATLVADPDGATVAATVRQAIAHTLTIALIAARETGHYSWTTLIDIDQLVTDAAWDQLDKLADTPPDTVAP